MQLSAFFILLTAAFSQLTLAGSPAVSSLQALASSTSPKPCTYPNSISLVKNYPFEHHPMDYAYLPQRTSGSECCRACQNTNNCMSARWRPQSHNCTLQINTTMWEWKGSKHQPGKETTERCPLGVVREGDKDQEEQDWTGIIPGPCWKPHW